MLPVAGNIIHACHQTCVPTRTPSTWRGSSGTMTALRSVCVRTARPASTAAQTGMSAAPVSSSFFFCCCCSALFSYSTLGDQSCASRVSVTSPGARLTRQCRPVARWSSTPRTPPVARCLSAPRPQGQLASRHPYPDRVPHPSSSPTSLVLSPAAFRHLPRVQAGKRLHLTVSTLKLYTWITGFRMVRTSYCVCF